MALLITKLITKLESKSYGFEFSSIICFVFERYSSSRGCVDNNDI